MKETKGRTWLQLIYCVTVLGVVAAVLWFGLSSNTAQATANSTTAAVGAPVTFPGTNTGSVPDGPAGGTVCGDFGAPRDIAFAVTGMGAPLTDVRVSLTMTHTWVGDMEATLIAPGGAPSALIFKQTGGTTATACGDDSDMAGPYNFFDTAPASPTWWNAATTAGSAVPVAAGSYRSTAALTGANTTITPAFAGLTTGQINGTWTLRLRDGGEGDLGNVTAASLTLDGTGTLTPGDAPLDLNGDGRTDYVVVRNVGGGSGGQVGWFYNINGTGAPTVWYNWGISTDFFVMEDFDGDDKDDITVYRPSGSPPSNFYILRSSDSTAQISDLGLTGDDPTIVDDYDGDNKADVAVYRGGASAGQPSFWYYRGSLNPAIITYVQWGQNGDFPAPGDYDGNGSADFVVQRNNGSGQGAFWTRLSTGATPPVIVYGTSSDLILPGDYDGDGKTDICVARGSGGMILWSARRSIDGNHQFLMTAFGLSATDFPTQGDYDGDGKTDIAVWRPNADPAQNFFYVLNSLSGSATQFELGQQGDYPVANFNSH